MTNRKISELDTAATIDGSEMIPVAKGGLNYKVLISQIKSWISTATAAAAGLMSNTDKAKLDGIAPGATVNASDADLRDRATHTGTQSASTITGLADVAKTGNYSDLNGKPDLSLTGLGALSSNHAGAGGSGVHPDASSTASGFMTPAMLQKLNETYNSVSGAARVASTGDYNDLSNKPIIPTNLDGLSDVVIATQPNVGDTLVFDGAVFKPGPGGSGGSGTTTVNLAVTGNIVQPKVPTGFVWTASSAASWGQAFGDYALKGATGAYVAISPVGGSYLGNTPHQTFTSPAGVGNIAGISSNEAVVKRGAAAGEGGFVYEAVFQCPYQAGSAGAIGLFKSNDVIYAGSQGQDWPTSVEGIGLCWDSTDTATSKWKIKSSDGNVLATGATAATETIGSDNSYFVKIKCDPGASTAYVTMKNLDTGAIVFNNVAINSSLPNGNSVLFGLAHTCTRALTGAVSMNLFSLGAYASAVVDPNAAGDLASLTHPKTYDSPANDGDMVFERTSDTSLTIKLKGSDGVIRSVVLALA